MTAVYVCVDCAHEYGRLSIGDCRGLGEANGFCERCIQKMKRGDGCRSFVNRILREHDEPAG